MRGLRSVIYVCGVVNNRARRRRAVDKNFHLDDTKHFIWTEKIVTLGRYD